MFEGYSSGLVVRLVVRLRSSGKPYVRPRREASAERRGEGERREGRERRAREEREGRVMTRLRRRGWYFRRKVKSWGNYCVLWGKTWLPKPGTGSTTRTSKIDRTCPFSLPPKSRFIRPRTMLRNKLATRLVRCGQVSLQKKTPPPPPFHPSLRDLPPHLPSILSLSPFPFSPSFSPPSSPSALPASPPSAGSVVPVSTCLNSTVLER